ncbi:hypothetical protein PoB_007497900 [Plakobranchus ocellatus]|uniref:Uncharacterized protein n=1 Tax=Plakobranchus ocellatus TaxID=259542 RepID=A0AAV4DWB0_9GAST|nr:hypothetical protein PoB_007497900 [Plakobranchus ocellatus]
MDSPIADVILGNINGLSSESSPFDSNSSDVFPNSSIACVITRARASKASIGNDLPISNNSTDFNVLGHFSDLPVRQREDPSLKPWFQRVGLPPVAGVSFRIEDGILKRLHTGSKFSSVQTTVAVPKSLRQVVLSYAHESAQVFGKPYHLFVIVFLGLVFVPMSGTTSLLPFVQE